MKGRELSIEQPRAYVSANRFGAYFMCAHCTAILRPTSNWDDVTPRTMTHGIRTGVFWRRPSTCPFAGKTFKEPAFNLEEAEPPTK